MKKIDLRGKYDPSTSPFVSPKTCQYITTTITENFKKASKYPDQGEVHYTTSDNASDFSTKPIVGYPIGNTYSIPNEIETRYYTMIYDEHGNIKYEQVPATHNETAGLAQKIEEPVLEDDKDFSKDYKEEIQEWLKDTTAKEEGEEGLRFNNQKIDLAMLSPIAQYCESLVRMYGEKKYDRHNFKKFKQDKDGISGEDRANLEFLQSLKRHIWAIERGEFLDKESELPHAAHAIWNLACMLDLYYLGNNHGKDGKDLYHQPLRTELPKIK